MLEKIRWIVIVWECSFCKQILITFIDNPISSFFLFLLQHCDEWKLNLFRFPFQIGFSLFCWYSEADVISHMFLLYTKIIIIVAKVFGWIHFGFCYYFHCVRLLAFSKQYMYCSRDNEGHFDIIISKNRLGTVFVILIKSKDTLKMWTINERIWFDMIV